MAGDREDQPARPRIVLPSLKEVQAAQKSRAAPNMFQARAASGPSSLPAASGSSTATTPAFSSAHNARQPTATFSDAPNASTLAAAQQAVPNMPDANGAGTSNRAAAGPPGTSYYMAQPCRKSVVDYKAMNANPNAILVSKRQEGNPLLKHIRNVRWSYADIVPDYIMGADMCALFLSMRFHLLKPEYVHHRIKELQRSFRLRVLVCHVDIDDVVEPLQQITRAALLNDVTLICGWSPEECARYLETYKVYETKPADAILGRTDEDYLSRLNAAFTTVRGVNKTDVLTLGNGFGTAARTMQASIEELSACPGIGPTKVKRLYDAFHEPFRKTLQPQAGTSGSHQQAHASNAGLGTMLPAQEMPAELDSEGDDDAL